MARKKKGTSKDSPGKALQGGTPSSVGPSQTPPATPSQTPSVAPLPQLDGPADHPRTNPFGPGLGYDPAKPPPKKESVIQNTRMDLPQAAYRLDFDAAFKSPLPSRPGTNNGTGAKDVLIRVNQFKVTQFPQKDIYQYDVHIAGQPGVEVKEVKKGLMKALWYSRTAQAFLQATSQYWLWNGEKIAWCDSTLPGGTASIKVDLDEERGRAPNPKHPNKFIIYIRQTKVVRLAVINAFLTRKMAFDNSILEAINFLDHLMRQMPSSYYTLIKRSFFAPAEKRFPLDTAIEAMKGVYSSLRLCDVNPSFGTGTGVALNIDVANGAFWTPQPLHQAARNYCREPRNRNLDFTVFQRLLLPVKVKDRQGNYYYTQSEDFKNLRKMQKLKFTVKHRGKTDERKEYTIKEFYFPNDMNATPAKQAYWAEGAHSMNYKFSPKVNGVPGPEISVYNYFIKKYNIHLQFPKLPLVFTAKAGHFPMELCYLSSNQQYKYKMSPEQTASMIKFAVTRPKERLQAITHGVGMLKWTQDPFLKHYGLRVDPSMSMTKARLIKNPEIQFQGAKLNPGYSGRWDLRGKKFYQGNTMDLKSWGILIMDDCCTTQAVQNFFKIFIQTYVGHGGMVSNRLPLVKTHKNDGNLGEVVAKFRTEVALKFAGTPQILFFIMSKRDNVAYERLKKSMDGRYANMSQMLSAPHIQKASPQYCSNVAMKVNAKLGGTTSKVAGPNFFKERTMVIGADVSHASPGSPQASMAALTMSVDSNACRFAAAVQTNGYRVEMITAENLREMIIPIFKLWVKNIGAGEPPSHIYYFRDGVSEAQYQHVLDQEVADMKKLIAEGFPKHIIKWTVTICSKRHHIRFFPKDGDSVAGDRNQNPLPGTLVERDVTHPFEYDFYLNAHSAIQGTARPVHYHVILDEANVSTTDFQRMIYHMSYQYMRSTTPVSLIPAVYYAHLASNRARAHENVASSDGPRGGQKFTEMQNERVHKGGEAKSFTSSQDRQTVAPKLVPLGEEGKIPEPERLRFRTGMWYI